LVNKWVNVNKAHAIFPHEWKGKRRSEYHQPHPPVNDRDGARDKSCTALKQRPSIEGTADPGIDLNFPTLAPNASVPATYVRKNDIHSGDSTTMKTSATATTITSSHTLRKSAAGGTPAPKRLSGKLVRSHSDILRQQHDRDHTQKISRRHRLARPGPKVTSDMIPPRHPLKGKGGNPKHASEVSNVLTPPRNLDISKNNRAVSVSFESSLAVESSQRGRFRRKNRKNLRIACKNTTEQRDTIHAQSSNQHSIPTSNEYIEILNAMHPAQNNKDKSDYTQCRCCKQMEHNLDLMLNDLEYLRSIILQYENDNYSCDPSVGWEASNNLRDAMYRIDDVTNRHKKQIEEIAKERARWQNDMHLKLSKFALMCKELNEESAKRSRDALSTKQELSAAIAERDALASKVEILGAKIARLERENLENKLLRDTLSQKDNDRLDQYEAGIIQRDTIIRDLTEKLKMTMDTLQNERQMQRDRRIIFPIVKPAVGPKEKISLSVRDLQNQLANAQEASKLAQYQLEDERNAAATREELLHQKCDKLAGQLRNLDQFSSGSRSQSQK